MNERDGQNAIAQQYRELMTGGASQIRLSSSVPLAKPMSLPDCVLQLSQRAEYLKKQLEDKIAMENELKSIELMLNALKAPR